jgi:glycosyltransferase involved in cell wall biosynthesis
MVNADYKGDIYILHEYGDDSHVKALFDEIDNYGYHIKGSIVLSKKAIIKKFIKGFIKNKKYILSINIFINDVKNLLMLKKIHNKILIVGIAPYDKILNKYNKVFKNNDCIYFTSWQYWDGSNFPRGSIKNKQEFENILKSNFKSAACVSNSTKKGIDKYFKFSQVVNHSIKVDEYKKKMISTDVIIADEKIKFLYLGKLIKRKNIKIIVNWIKSNTSNEFKFYFAGDGQLTNDILKLSERDKRVIYLGRISKEEIKKTLKNYNFLVLPSKSEPFGIVLIEALAAGVPCIVSNALGPVEIIKNNFNGYIFDKNNIEQFYEVMNHAININKNDYYKMSKNCLNDSYKYDTKNIVKKWLKLINYSAK